MWSALCAAVLLAHAPRATAQGSAMQLLHNNKGVPLKTTLTKQTILAIDPLAVCNDGTGGVYYWAQATTPAMSQTWVIFLEGKDWCYDYMSCSGRFHNNPTVMSTNGWPNERAEMGLFSPNPAKNPFAGANFALLGYCSSDAWVGDVGASVLTYSFSFRGQRILNATIGSLVTQHGLGSGKAKSGQPDRVLLAGSMAGGRGAMFSIDSIQGMLARAGVAKYAVTVQGLFDAAMLIPEAPLYARITSLEEQTQKAIGLFNASSLYGKTCQYVNSQPTMQWSCLFPSTRLKFIQTPFLLSAPQFDKWQLKYDMGGALPPFTTDALTAYADGFQMQMVKAAAGVTSYGQTTYASNALFSAACFKGQTLRSAGLWGVLVSEDAEVPQPSGLGSVQVLAAGAPLRSLRDVLAAWFFGGVGGLTVADTCAGFGCGTGCRGRNMSKPLPMKEQEQAAAQAAAAQAAAAAVDAARKASHRRTAGAVLVLLLLASCLGWAATKVLPPRPERLTPAQRRAAEEGIPLRARAPYAADSVLHGNPTMMSNRFGGF